MSKPPVRGKSSARIHASACMCLWIYTCVCVYAVGVPVWGLLQGHTPLQRATPPSRHSDEAATSTTSPAGACLQPYEKQGGRVGDLAWCVGGARNPGRATLLGEASVGQRMGGGKGGHTKTRTQ